VVLASGSRKLKIEVNQQLAAIGVIPESTVERLRIDVALAGITHLDDCRAARNAWGMKRVTPSPTLEQLRSGHPRCWVVREKCLHRRPVAFVPLIIRWRPDTSSDALQARTGARGRSIGSPRLRMRARSPGIPAPAALQWRVQRRTNTSLRGRAAVGCADQQTLDRGELPSDANRPDECRRSRSHQPRCLSRPIQACSVAGGDTRACMVHQDLAWAFVKLLERSARRRRPARRIAASGRPRQRPRGTSAPRDAYAAST
jgi:hypothetical protein